MTTAGGTYVKITTTKYGEVWATRTAEHVSSVSVALDWETSEDQFLGEIEHPGRGKWVAWPDNGRNGGSSTWTNRSDAIDAVVRAWQG